MDGILAGKVAIVTGAGRGIGRALALQFARQGAAVVVNNRSPEPIGEVVAAIAAEGGTAVGQAGDVADFAFAADLVGQAAERFGRLDVLVNNAGIVRDRMIVSMTEDDWDEAVRVNLRGTFAPLQAAARHWRAAAKAGPMEGAIINMTSSSGLYHNPSQANYGAAKAGVANLTITASAELARYGVRVNAVGPTAATRMSEAFIPAEKRREGNFDRYDPAAIVFPVAWLASDAAREITGRVFEIRGDRISLSEGWLPGPAIETALPWTAESLGLGMLELHRRARPNADVFGVLPRASETREE